MANVWEEEWLVRGGHVVRRLPADDTAAVGDDVLDVADVVPGGADRARLAAAAPDLARALLAVESAGWKCPECSGFHHGSPGLSKPKNHQSWCSIDAALRKAGVRL